MTVIPSPVNTPQAWSERASLFDRSWEACGWTEDGQRDRHLAVLAALDPQPGERLLDWGCGTGDLSWLLPGTVFYTGFDFATGMVERARRDYPGRTFLDWEPLGRFDMVACVGPFNLPGSKLHTWSTLRRLWDRCDRVLAASVYAGTDPACLSYTLAECERFAHSESYYGRATQWRSNDILIVLERR